MKQQLYGPKRPVTFDPPYNDSACQQPHPWTVRQAQMHHPCAREPDEHIPHRGYRAKAREGRTITVWPDQQVPK